MSFIFTIIGLMISLDVIWWIVLARLTNHVIGRVLVSIFMLAMMVGLISVIAARMSRGDWDRFIPKFAVSAIFIWHFIGLGLLSLIGLALIPILLGQKIVRVARHAPVKVRHRLLDVPQLKLRHATMLQCGRVSGVFGQCRVVTRDFVLQ